MGKIQMMKIKSDLCTIKYFLLIFFFLINFLFLYFIKFNFKLIISYLYNVIINFNILNHLRKE